MSTALYNHTTQNHAIKHHSFYFIPHGCFIIFLCVCRRCRVWSGRIDRGSQVGAEEYVRASAVNSPRATGKSSYIISSRNTRQKRSRYMRVKSVTTSRMRTTIWSNTSVPYTLSRPVKPETQPLRMLLILTQHKVGSFVLSVSSIPVFFFKIEWVGCKF